MEFLDKYSIKAHDLSLYETAFTHTSYANENNIESYERLEYLGDAVLELIMSEYLYKKEDFKEGKMTKLRATYVCENALYEYSTKLNLAKFIKVGHGEEKEGTIKKSIIADIFEALIGAIYLDLGYATARRTVLNVIVPYIEDPNTVFFSDYKSALQEYVQTEQKTLVYDLVDEYGPAHDKTFVVEVKIEDIVYGKGIAKSKKEAEQNAAKEALEKCAK